MMKILFSAAVLIATALPVAMGRAEPGEMSDRVRVVYAPSKNPAFARLGDELRKEKLLGHLHDFLSPFRLPRELTLRFEDCNGELNAWYEDNVVTVCYDYIAFIKDNAAKVPETLKLGHDAAFVGASLDLILHEFGHAVFDMLKIPVLGREEDAADLFSAYIMLQFASHEALQLIKATAYLSLTEGRRDQKPTPTLKDFANEHALPAQRYFNLLCMAYGSDPDAFAGALQGGKLPIERAEGCKQEYEQIKYAFTTLIGPHLDRARLEAVRARTWFDFADDAGR